MFNSKINFYLLFLSGFFSFFGSKAQTCDPNFRPIFSVVGSSRIIEVFEDGKLLLACKFDAVGNTPTRGLVKLNNDGTIDPAFDYDPTILGLPSRVKILDDNKIIIVGAFKDSFGGLIGQVLRLMPDGSLDTSFKPIIDPTIDFFDEVDILPNQKILISYYKCISSINQNCGVYGVRLYKSNGFIDDRFPNIEFNIDSLSASGSTISDIGAQSDNALIVIGTNLQLDTLIRTGFRFDSVGNVDLDFNPQVNSLSNFQTQELEILEDGTFGILSGGDSFFSIFDSLGVKLSQRYAENRDAILTSVDNEYFVVVGEKIIKHELPGGWTTYPGFTGRVLAANSFGSNLLVTGGINEYRGEFIPGILRLIDNGNNFQIDSTFRTKLYAKGAVRSIAVQDNGKIIAGGFFNFVNGQRINHLVRLNEDGSIDTTFDFSNTSSSSQVFALALVKKGNIIICSNGHKASGEPKIGALSILDSNGVYIMDLPFPYYLLSRNTNPTIIEKDKRGNIYVGNGAAYGNGNENSSQPLAKYEFFSDNTFKYINYDSIFIDRIFRYNEIEILPNNKILLSGRDIWYDGAEPSSIIVADEDGQRSTLFRNGFQEDFYGFEALAIDSNSILISGFNRNSSDGVFAEMDLEGKKINDFSDYLSLEGNKNFRIQFLEKLPNSIILLRGVFDLYQGIPIPPGRGILIDTLGNYISDFLPDLILNQFLDIAIIDENTIYLAGQITGPNCGVGLIKVNLGLTTRVNKLSSDKYFDNLTVYPNPIKGGILRLKVPDNYLNDRFNYQIIDAVSGKVEKIGVFQNSSGEGVLINDLNKGVFLMKLYNERFEFVQKFIKI